MVGGPTLGSLSPVWIRQRLEREWQRAEEAEEELQAALARRDVAEADTAKLKVRQHKPMAYSLHVEAAVWKRGCIGFVTAAQSSVLMWHQQAAVSVTAETLHTIIVAGCR